MIACVRLLTIIPVLSICLRSSLLKSYIANSNSNTFSQCHRSSSQFAVTAEEDSQRSIKAEVSRHYSFFGPIHLRLQGSNNPITISICRRPGIELLQKVVERAGREHAGGPYLHCETKKDLLLWACLRSRLWIACARRTPRNAQIVLSFTEMQPNSDPSMELRP